MSLKLLFAGSHEISAIILQALLDQGYPILGVLTQPDRPSGRGLQTHHFNPVKKLALTHHIPILQPASLRKPEIQAELAQYPADLMIVVAYGLIVPKAVLEMPKLGCWNVHVSLLPRWRGAAPVQRAIEAGDAVTGVSVMQMDEGLDTGPVYYQLSHQMTPQETGGTLHETLAHLGVTALLHTLTHHSEMTPFVQDDSLATYAHKIEKTEGTINWHENAEKIALKVRAFNPWPVCFTHLGDMTLRIWQAEALPTSSGKTPGQILKCAKDGILVACGEGTLNITALQLPNKRTMSAQEILNGHRSLFEPLPCLS